MSTRAETVKRQEFIRAQPSAHVAELAVAMKIAGLYSAGTNLIDIRLAIGRVRRRLAKCSTWEKAS